MTVSNTVKKHFSQKHFEKRIRFHQYIVPFVHGRIEKKIRNTHINEQTHRAAVKTHCYQTAKMPPAYTQAACD